MNIQLLPRLVTAGRVRPGQVRSGQIFRSGQAGRVRPAEQVKFRPGQVTPRKARSAVQVRQGHASQAKPGPSFAPRRRLPAARRSGGRRGVAAAAKRLSDPRFTARSSTHRLGRENGRPGTTIRCCGPDLSCETDVPGSDTIHRIVSGLGPPPPGPKPETGTQKIVQS